ncbi:hypothetical protein DPMN_033700, partial [Dreissena polymorpha]
MCTLEKIVASSKQFKFPSWTSQEVTRYLPTFNISNYKQHLRRFLSLPMRSPNNDDVISPSSAGVPSQNDNDVFFTPTSSLPPNLEIKSREKL